jgi:hypothetical protein
VKHARDIASVILLSFLPHHWRFWKIAVCVVRDDDDVSRVTGPVLSGRFCLGSSSVGGVPFLETTWRNYRRVAHFLAIVRAHNIIQLVVVERFIDIDCI